MTIAVVCDSAAGLSASQAAELGVHVVPMAVHVDSDTYLDGSMEPGEMTARMRAGSRVSTSAASPGEYLEAMSRLDADDVVVVSMSSTLSVSCRSAEIAAESLRSSGRRVHVVDSRVAAGAQALVVTAVVRAVRAGSSVDSVLAEAGRVADRVRLVARVGSLEWLARSGRVPGLAARIGDGLGVIPLFALDSSGIHRVRPSRSVVHADRRIVEDCVDGSGSLRVAAMHTGDEGVARRLLDSVAGRVEISEPLVVRFSAGMVAHTGPDLVGLAWWRDV